MRFLTEQPQNSIETAQPDHVDVNISETESDARSLPGGWTQGRVGGFVSEDQIKRNRTLDTGHDQLPVRGAGTTGVLSQ